VEANLKTTPCPTSARYGLLAGCRIRPVLEVGSPDGVSVQRQLVVSTVIRAALVPFGIVALTGADEEALVRRSWPRHW
jgi:hypothetical protein